MKLQLIRHASLWVEYAGVKLLIDPMFSEAGANDPIAGTANAQRNPLVPIASPLSTWTRPDAVFVTHLHRDHWDEPAAELLPKTTPVYCQPGDEDAFRKAGFTEVHPVVDSLLLEGIAVHRTGGRHGTGEIGERMGRVSGFVFRKHGEPTLYAAGDTIWCDEVRSALADHRPDVTVVNAGGARFVSGDPITMDEDDVVSVCRYTPGSQIAAVHMDAINHCLVTRAMLRERLAEEQLLDQVRILADGEWL